MKILSDSVVSNNVRQVVMNGEAQESNERLAEDARAKLRSDLNVALSQSHVLQDELDQTQYRLAALARNHQDMQQELRDAQDVRKEQVGSLLARMAELEADLEQARQRAKAAEKHAEENARLLDDIREQAHSKWFDAPAQGEAVDQSQQDQIDALAEREAKLMQQLNDMEQLLKRNLTEKEFIEERFLQLTPKI
jgi:chromosome segregation ATPase